MSAEQGTEARRPIAVLLSRFPVVTETFILREIIEMERQGQPVRLVPLLRESPATVHQEAEPWIQKALYTPFLSPPILLSNLRAVFSHPFLYFGLLFRLVLASLAYPRFLLGTLGIFPKSVHLAAQLAREGICHVHCHFGSHPATAALIISAFSEATFSVTIHAHDLFVSRYTPFLESKLRTASFVRVISEFNRKRLLDNYPSVAADKVHVVHVGVPVADYQKEEEGRGDDADSEAVVSEAPPGALEGIRLLSVAGLRPYKGLSTLVEACTHLEDGSLDFCCTIVGEGPLRTTLEHQIEAAGLRDRVRLAGAMTQNEVAGLLMERPIFVLPSVILRDGMMDGIPVALMEAMASGAPVVASRLSGIPELIEDGRSGILIEPGDSLGLARSILRISRDPGLARSLAKEGAERVKSQFSLDRCTVQLLDLIDKENPPHKNLLPQSPAWERHLRFGRSGMSGGSGRTFGARILHEGQDSRVVEVLPTNHGNKGSLVVKVHTDRPGQSESACQRARKEYDVMASVTSRWWDGAEGDAGSYPVPRLTDLDQEAGLLVMEASNGRRLDQILRAARLGGDTSLKAAAMAMEKAGEWLRQFQRSMGPPVPGEEAVGTWQAELRRNLDRSRGILPRKLWADAEASVSDLCSTGRRMNVIPSGYHGDFWPGNVLVTPGGVQVVDFEGFRPGVAHEDPAYFLIQSEFFFDYPFLRRRYRDLASAFRKGYGDEDLLASGPYRASRMSVCLRLLSLEAEMGGRNAVLAQRRLHRLRLILEEVIP
jgi:glycosyltransferase involved in cell wall biosynthesis